MWRACVIGIPHEKWGEAVHAVVVPAPGASIDPDELIAWSGQYLAGYKKPRRIEFVGGLPKTANGKIDKKVLRSKYGTSSFASADPAARS